MSLTIIGHDMDHVRQAHHWCYTIPASLCLINLLVYAPSMLALFLTFRHKRVAALTTIFNGLFVAISFAEVHLWRPSIPVWGIWNTNFFLLGVDAISWIVLAITVFVGVGVAMAGVYVCGRQSLTKA